MKTVHYAAPAERDSSDLVKRLRDPYQDRVWPIREEAASRIETLEHEIKSLIWAIRTGAGEDLPPPKGPLHCREHGGFGFMSDCLECLKLRRDRECPSTK